ncbi:peptidylprolyl isomerase [Tepidicaulis marinus]|uniref:peptidylprolyl isomerase n=1 Tax=Tepidicaulis marinus TaxID=1333998 RepID=UPI0005F06D1A|nr:peptidylprolyl isomerase [Tepidicaulis marinus]
MSFPSARRIFPLKAAFFCAGLTLAGSFLLPAIPALGQDVQGIAAVVNDRVVSRYDVEQRMKLVLSTSSLPATPENIERVRSQVLRGLIDEKLQVAEARRLELEVSEEEVDEALERVASRSNRSKEEITEFLKANDIDIETLRSQIYADIAWNKVISNRFAPLVTIGDQEVDEKMRQIEQEANQVQYHVAEIYLGFENAAQEREMQNGARRLVEQMRQGVPFPAVAAQFSQSATAAAGGDIGWLAASQLPSPIADEIVKMSPGEISDPIKTLNGFYIVQLINKQQGNGPNPLRNRFEVIRVLFPVAPDAPAPAVQARRAQADELISNFRTCPRVSEQAAAYPGAQASQPTEVEAGQIQEPLRGLLQAREAGEIAPPQRTPQGIEVFIVCNRWDDQGAQITRDNIENNLFNQRLSMMARRHLRDLRRDAIVEMR